eukprot:3862735-Rhodomonas_salina.1
MRSCLVSTAMTWSVHIGDRMRELRAHLLDDDALHRNFDVLLHDLFHRHLRDSDARREEARRKEGEGGQKKAGGRGR